MSERVVLVGPPGVGKTTVGRALARRLGWPFRDLDEEVERRVGLTVDRVLVERGEESFRREEAAALEALLRESPLVLASGGGSPCWGDNLARMERVAFVVALDACLDTLAQRVVGGARPLLGAEPREGLAVLLEARAGCYARIRRRVATDGRSVDEVVALVLAMREEQ